MDLAVVIPAFKTPPPILKKCLDSVLKQMSGKDNVDVIVIDSSSAEFPEELADYRDKVSFTFTKRRMFAGEARNFGASKTEMPFLAFLDSDCCWSSDWLKVANHALAFHPDSLAFNGQVLFECPDECWGYALHLLEFHEFISSREHSQRFLHSGNLLIRASFFHQVGGFRADWPACEDIGFLQALSSDADVNRKIRFIPKLCITHTAHLVQKKECIEKMRFMGYWRGFYDAKLPDQFQLHNTRALMIRWHLLGFAFWAVMILRSIKLRSVLLRDILVRSPQIFRLAFEWGRSFSEGLAKANTGHSSRSARRRQKRFSR